MPRLSKAEEDWLIENYRYGLADAATHLGRSKKSVQYFAQKLGLRVDNDVWKRHSHEAKRSEMGTVKVFSYKGHAPDLRIKVDHCKWVPYGRWVWEHSYGEIPNGYRLFHLDGNSLNCELDNMVLVPFKYALTINREGWNTPELLPFALLWCELHSVINNEPMMICKGEKA